MSDTIKKKLVVEDEFSQSFNDYVSGVKKVGKSSDKANPSISKTESAMAGAGKAVTGFVAAYISMQSLKIAEDLAEVAAQAELVDKSFTSMATKVGSSNDEMMKKMRAATSGMVDDMQLQRSAMQALQAGIDPTAMITSMKFVSRFALSVGKDANQLMNTVMTGLARGSAQFLDDVGIQVMGSADVVGDAIDQMNDKMLEEPEGAFISITQYRAEAKNLKNEIGDNLVPTLELWEKTQVRILRGLKSAIEGVKLLRDQDPWDKQIWKMEAVRKKLIQIEELQDARILSKNTQLKISAIEKEVKAITGKYSDEIGSSKTLSSMIAHRTVEVERNAKAVRKASNEAADAAAVAVEAHKEIQKNIDAKAKSLEDSKKAEKERIAQEKRDVASLKRAKLDAEKELEQARKLSANVEKATLQRTTEGKIQVLNAEELAHKKFIENSKMLDTEEEKALLSIAEEYALKRNDVRSSEAETIFRASQEEIRIEEENTAKKLDLIKLEQQARSEMISSAMVAGANMAAMFASFGQARTNRALQALDAEKEAVQESEDSAEEKEKKLKAIDKKRKAAQEEQAKRNAVMAVVQAATNTALTIQSVALAAASAAAQGFGGPAIKIASALAVGGALAGLVGSSVSAASSIPKREHGGNVRQGGLYEVAENGKDELFTSGGKTFMIPSQSGRITPNVNNNQQSRVNNITFNITGSQDASATINGVVKGLEIADRQGSLDWGGMPGFNRAVVHLAAQFSRKSLG